MGRATMMMGVGLSHAVKHKGGIGSVVVKGGQAASAAEAEGAGSEEYERELARFRRRAKQLAASRAGMQAYMEATSKLLAAVTAVAAAFEHAAADPLAPAQDAAADGAASAPTPPGMTAGAPLVFRHSWHRSVEALESLLVEGLFRDGVANLGTAVAAAEQVT